MKEMQLELSGFYDTWADKIHQSMDKSRKSLFDVAKNFRSCSNAAKKQFHHDIKTTWNNLNDRIEGFVKYQSFTKAIKTDKFINELQIEPKRLDFSAIKEIATSKLEEEKKKDLVDRYESSVKATDSSVKATDSSVRATIPPSQTEIRKEIKEEQKEEEVEERKKETKKIEISNLYQGDCIETIKTLKDNSVDCLLTDPPYGIDFKSNHGSVHSKIDNDVGEEAFELLSSALEISLPKLKEGSHVYIFTSWKVYPRFLEIISKHLTIKNLLVWVKNNWSMGDLESNYAEQYELIIYCCKGKARQLVSDKRPTNVLTFDRVVSQLHPTEKPVDLLKELINNSTVDNEVVLDPFAGSGSLGVACQETTRQFILIEKEEEYCNIIKKRLG